MSEHLYRKPASAVTLPEAALIAGLIQAPSTFSPWSNYEGALERSRVVLAQMRDQGMITEAQERAARAVRPQIPTISRPNDTRAAWAKDFLRQQFRNEFGGDHPPDWQVRTTFSARSAGCRRTCGGPRIDPSGRPGLQAALVALDPQTGDIYAMVGGANYGRSTYNRATRSKRQPGSAFKPFVYAAALEHGYSPVSVLHNLRNVTAPDNPEWNPTTAHGDQPDEMTLRAALLESNNAAAADLQQSVGIPGRAPPRQHGWPEQPAGRAVTLPRHRRRLAARSRRGLCHLCSERRIGEGRGHHERLRRARV
jgi:penicillin-binding protein 1A